MPKRFLLWMMLVLFGLAFLGGTTVQALLPGSASKLARVDSPMPGCADEATAQKGTPAPHKGITPDCVKLMKCLGIPFPPGQALVASAPVAYATAAYWSHDPLRGGLSPAPLPFPPRSA